MPKNTTTGLSGMRWFIGAELAAVESLWPATGQGLEIGVGTGRFAVPLGIKIGVEPARAMAEIAKTGEY